MEALTEQQVTEQYPALSSHQRTRILTIHKSCQAAASAIYYNTPHTPEIEESVQRVRELMDLAVETIVTENSR